MSAQPVDTSVYDTVDWANPYNFASTPETRSAYKNGYTAGYDAAIADIRKRKSMQREIIDAAIIDRFTEILSDLRGRAA